MCLSLLRLLYKIVISTKRINHEAERDYMRRPSVNGMLACPAKLAIHPKYVATPTLGWVKFPILGGRETFGGGVYYP